METNETKLTATPIAEAAERLGVSVRRVRYAVRTGEVLGAKIFGRYFLQTQEIDRLINKRPPPPSRIFPDAA